MGYWCGSCDRHPRERPIPLPDRADNPLLSHSIKRFLHLHRVLVSRRGVVEPGETFEGAPSREAYEEIGLRASPEVESADARRRPAPDLCRAEIHVTGRTGARQSGRIRAVNRH